MKFYFFFHVDEESKNKTNNFLDRIALEEKFSKFFLCGL